MTSIDGSPFVPKRPTVEHSRPSLRGDLPESLPFRRPHFYEKGMMRIPLPIRVFLCMSVACCLCACRYGSTDTVGSSSPSNLQVQSKSPGILRRYNSFYIADIEVYAVEGDYLRRVDDKEVQNLAEEFRSKLIRNLGDQYATIPQRASNTAVIKVALTDATTSYGVFQILPGAIVPNALRGGASIDASIVDSVSNQEIVRVRDSRQGARQGFFSGLGKWDGTEKAFDEWAQVLASAVKK